MSLAQATALHATLDLGTPPPRHGDPLPHMWHWIYCTQKAPRSEIAQDGHPRKGGFLPPVPLPRRMFAGCAAEIVEPIRIGAEIVRISTILSVEEKRGRSGALAFVKVRHEYRTGDVLNLIDTHTIVYRGPSIGDEASRSTRVEPPGWVQRRMTVHPDPVLLFRYSALIFVGHRIHYDRPYTTEVEGYPGLLVHGPLLATLMAELARMEGGIGISTVFEFQARAPIFDTAPFDVVAGDPDEGGGRELGVIGPDGAVCATGRTRPQPG